MKKALIIVSVLLLAICGVFIAFAPDVLSLIVVSVMLVVAVVGHVFGVIPNFLFCFGFRNGRASIDSIKKIAADSKWAAIRQIKPFFSQRTLDGFFDSYLEKTQKQQDDGLIIGDIEDFINEDSLEIRNWRGVVLQVSGILTALGLLGTFLGLMIGISSVSFGTLDATITSIESLLAGIATAFYTSIAGVILSVIFNLLNRIVWNLTVREMNLFIEKFHLEVQPYSAEQLGANGYLQNEEIIRLLTQINNSESKNAERLFKDSSYEQRLMVQILAGVRNNEFSTVFEPVCKLENRTVVKAEAKLRWQNKTMGIINNSTYFPVIESNGYLVKLEKMVWRDAAEDLSRLKKNGRRAVPVVFRVSKMFLMSANIAAYLDALVSEFDLTPRDFEISISADFYLTCYAEVIKYEQILLKKGYKVTICGYSGDMLDLPETNAEEIILDVGSSDIERLTDVFNRAMKKNLTVSVENVVSAKQLTELRKLGCDFGKGRHLYPEMTATDFAELINGETL